LKNKKIALTFLLIGLTLMLIPVINHANAMEEDLGIPVVIRARGVAIAHIGENETILIPTHLVLRGLLFKPMKIGNLSIAPLAIRDGILEIGLTKFNITRGKGALVLEKHDIIIGVNGTSPRGENISLRLFGKWIKLPDETILLMKMAGVVKFEDDGKLFLLLRAYAFPRQLRQLRQSVE